MHEEYPVALRADSYGASGLSSVGLAMRRALASQLQPRMLLALLLPFFIAFLGAVILLWLFWSPLTGWLDSSALDWGVLNATDQWLVGIGLFSIKLYLVPLLALAILLPLSGILGLIVAAVFVMPVVLSHVGKRDYPDVSRQGKMISAIGVWNALWVGLVFCVGWVVTLPLWLVPPFAVVLPLWWWTYAFTRMLRVDALVEHASNQECRALWRRHNRHYWLIGFCMALINLFPPAWLVLPVFSALVFAHFSLEALRQLRRQAAISAEPAALQGDA